jgi:hypothetical protein
MMTDWLPMSEAPKDGTQVRLRLDFIHGVPAYWDDDLKTWVLSRPLHMESIKEPQGWKK